MSCINWLFHVFLRSPINIQAEETKNVGCGVVRSPPNVNGEVFAVSVYIFLVLVMVLVLVVVGASPTCLTFNIVVRTTCVATDGLVDS